MSDQPSAPRRRPAPPDSGPSAQSKWIGFVVLGFGVVAVAAVLIIALGRGAGEGAAPDQTEISTQKMAESLAPPPVEKSPAPAQQSYKRQEDIKVTDIAGAWQTQINGGKAVLALENGTYRLIVVFVNTNMERLYSSGTYRLIGDVLVLSPKSPQLMPQDGYGYRLLTQSEFPLLVGMHKGKLVWQKPERSHVPSDIYVPSTHPFLSWTDSGIAVWDTLK